MKNIAFKYTSWNLSKKETVSYIQDTFWDCYGLKANKSDIYITDIIDVFSIDSDGIRTDFHRILFVIRPAGTGKMFSYTLSTDSDEIVKR